MGMMNGYAEKERIVALERNSIAGQHFIHPEAFPLFRLVIAVHLTSVDAFVKISESEWVNEYCGKELACISEDSVIDFRRVA